MNPTLIYSISMVASNLINSALTSGRYETQRKEAHRNRLEELEIAYQQRLKELELVHEQRLKEVDSASESRIKEQSIIENIRSNYAIQTNAAIRQDVKDNSNNPLVDSSDKTYEELKQIYQRTGKPIVLVAPFWNDALPKDVNLKGGFVDFRTAFNISYSRASWNGMASKQDGYIERPLNYTDRDINYIYSVLSDIPVILVHGTIQGVHGSTQYIQRIHPCITFWNLFPDKQSKYNLNLEFFVLNLPLDNAKVVAQYSLQLQDLVGDYLAKLIGLLSTAYHLYHFGTRPQLTQFEQEKSPEIELLVLQMSSLYELLCEREPSRISYYQRQKEIMFSECKITQNEEKIMQDKSGISLDATNIRRWFANRLEEMSQTLVQAEEQGKQKGASGELSLERFIKNLNDEIIKLHDAKFRFLVIGDFNRGKSTILNVLFGQENLLPVGVTACTAIPTFVKYGEQQKVLVHLKNGTVEELSLEEYKKKYTLNSKEVKNKIKQFFNSVGEWLNPLDYADFYYPVELLSHGVEFIDTAGLNHTLEEDEKTFAYINNCHAIIFVLSAEQQLTQKEKDYLITHIQQKVNTVFYLINKWEIIEDEEEKESIHEVFVEGFSESLKKDENEIRSMWGHRIFDIYARNALAKLKNKEPLSDTGFLEFIEKLNDFLTNERLVNELFPSVQIAAGATQSVIKIISDRLLVLNDDLESLEEKIKKVTPHIELMKIIVELLEKEIKDKKESCSEKIVISYKNYFLSRLSNFDTEFEMPQVSSLKEKDKEEYTSELSKKFSEYQHQKLQEWNKLTEADVIKIHNELKNLLDGKIQKYNEERENIRNILEKDGKNIQNQTQLPTYNESGEAADFASSSSNANAIGKIALGGAAGVSTFAAGVGVATAANVYLGSHLLIAAGLMLTPLGWGLLGASAIVGTALSLWGRSSEIEKFKQEMKKQLKESLKKAAEDENNLSKIKNHIEGLFAGFERITKELRDDVYSLEESFDNLLESKRQNTTNYQIEKNRLNTLSEEVLKQWEKVDKEYQIISNPKSS